MHITGISFLKPLLRSNTGSKSRHGGSARHIQAWLFHLRFQQSVDAIPGVFGHNDNQSQKYWWDGDPI